MIYMASTRNNAGITLYGDYYDLNSLYDTISCISECKVCKDIKGLNDYILALCYDIRHAYQRMREIKKLGLDKYDKATYYGVSIFWPMIIFQVRTLRWLAAFVPTTKEHQANLYRLEYSMEEALEEAGPSIARECIDILSTFPGLSTNYLMSFIDELCYEYVCLPKADRLKELPDMIRDMSPLSDKYSDFQSAMKLQAEKLNCSLYDLKLDQEFPEFEW